MGGGWSIGPTTGWGATTGFCMRTAASIIENLEPHWEGSRLHERLSRTCIDGVVGLANFGGDQLSPSEFRQFADAIARIASTAPGPAPKYPGKWAPNPSKVDPLISRLLELVLEDPRSKGPSGVPVESTPPAPDRFAARIPSFLLSAAHDDVDGGTRIRIRIGTLEKEYSVTVSEAGFPHAEFSGELASRLQRNPEVRDRLMLAVPALLEIGHISRPLMLGRAYEWPEVHPS